ncbi:aminotransferase class V-fold PLP-dependent enzyme [Nanchangia anserum]|uniref:aminotransferase class V-fold PLP-dependent enzyme n=1 Tax=Nanchangia anserum TaxID=2692125 RepID=UPI001D0FD3DB|nr:aminotransferase class V-fold PLP-dependent enzyme [Nanchangia anserum]
MPWQRLAARVGAEFAWLDLTPDVASTSTRSTSSRRIRRSSPLPTCPTSRGRSRRLPIVAAARNVGALVVLDTCQSAAHVPLDLHALDVDVAALSAHKMCGPTGIGALYVRREVAEALPPALVGGSMVADVAMETTTYQDPPLKFEAGTQPVAQIAGWKAAVEFLSGIGMERVAAHERHITEALIDAISAIDGVRLLGPAHTRDRVAVAAFTLGDVHPHDIGQVLDATDVAIRVGHHCAIPLHRFFGVRASARASASLTTTVDEIDRLARGLEQVRQFFIR